MRSGVDPFVVAGAGRIIVPVVIARGVAPRVMHRRTRCDAEEEGEPERPAGCPPVAFAFAADFGKTGAADPGAPRPAPQHPTSVATGIDPDVGLCRARLR